MSPENSFPPTQLAAESLSVDPSRRVWNNETYHTTIQWIDADNWTEYDLGATKPRLTYRELQRTIEYVELFCNERSQHLRIFDRRAELLKDGRWEWVANGNWRDAPHPVGVSQHSFASANGVARRPPAAAPGAAPKMPATGNLTRNVTDLVTRVEPAVVSLEFKVARGGKGGSGFIVDPAGIALTNFHVVEGALSGIAKFANGEIKTVTGVLRSDRERDLAVIQLGGVGGLPTLPVAEQTPRKGENVYAFGCPMGYAFSVTEGLVSAIRKGDEIEDALKGTWIQTSAPISHGNSGGPLVDLSGRVVGLNTLMSNDAQNLNFAICCLDIKDIVAQATGATLQSLPEHTHATQKRAPRRRSGGGEHSPRESAVDPRVQAELEKFAREREHRSERISSLLEKISAEKSLLKEAIFAQDVAKERRVVEEINKIREQIRSLLQPSLSFSSLDCDRLVTGSVGKLHSTTFLIAKVIDTEHGVCVAAPLSKTGQILSAVGFFGADLSSLADGERWAPPASAVFLASGVETIKHGKAAVTIHIIRQITDTRDFFIEEPVVEVEPDFSESERGRYKDLLDKRAERNEQRKINEKNEKAAHSKLLAAKQLIKLGKPSEARSLFKQILAEYPDTDAASEARELLGEAS